MDLTLYNEYRFTEGKLISNQSGKTYVFYLENNDRFYTYLKPHINAGKVSGLTRLMIDTLTIEDSNKSFFDEESFLLNAIILAKDKQDVFHAFNVTIKNIKINRVDVSKLAYKNENWVLDLFEMEIPYLTKIDVTEQIDWL